MDTPEESEREEAIAELVAEVSEEAIEEFTFSKLRSYYVENPKLAVNALTIYREALSLLDTSANASLILFVSSIEVGLKATILKPVIYGLVHNESAAELISELTVKQNGFDRIKNLLSTILEEYGAIDLNEFKINGHSKTIWQEITLLQVERNKVIHRCESTTAEIAAHAKEVSTMILGMFLPSILNSLSLELKKGFIIGNS